MSKSNIVEPSTKYSQVADMLRKRIMCGDLQPGDRLPSYTEVAAQGITQPTIQRAHAILEREGLIRREPRRGTFVTHRSARKQDRQPPREPSLMQHTVGVLANESFGVYEDLNQEGWAFMCTLGMVEYLRSKGLNTLMLHPDKIKARDLTLLRQDPPLGFVVMDFDWSEVALQELIFSLLATETPLVLNGNQRMLQHCDRVVSDHDTGAFLLTNYLIRQYGRRRILNLWPLESDVYWLDAKWIGYRRAMDQAGLQAMPPVKVPEKPVPNSLTREWFDQQARMFAGHLIEHLTGNNRVDAIMCYSDYIVPIAAAACRLFGLIPNEDVALVGYDNYLAESPIYSFENTLPLATIDKQNRAIGSKIGELLVSRLNGALPDTPQLILVEPTLIEV